MVSSAAEGVGVSQRGEVAGGCQMKPTVDAERLGRKPY